MANSIVVLRGLPGPMKSTTAARLRSNIPGDEWVVVCRDDIRMMLFGKQVGLSFPQEELVSEVEKAAVKAALSSTRNVIIDAMHLRPKYITAWYKFANTQEANLYLVEMPISVEQAIDRDANRAEPVGEDVIKALAAKYLPKGKYLPVNLPKDEAPSFKKVEQDERLPHVVLVDVDGTIALNTSGRSPYDWHRVGEDTPNKKVLELVQILLSERQVIFLSGRDEVCRKETEEWISKHLGATEPTLYMRPEGDCRKDSIVKKELFEKHIQNKYFVDFVLDDRNQVVKMWRDLGLTCLQVADGDF